MWTLVIAVNSVILTLFLWHMAAAIAAAVALYPTGILPIVPLDTTLWWWLRVPWVAACLLVLTVLVALFSAIERSVPGTRKQARVGGGGAAWLVVAGILATLTGLSGLALAGRGVHGPVGLPSEALIAYAVGVALLAWVGHGAWRHGVQCGGR